MNRPFLIFLGDKYYPAGGWYDFCDRFRTKREALIKAANLKSDWWHIVDLNSGKIVAQSSDKRV